VKNLRRVARVLGACGLAAATVFVAACGSDDRNGGSATESGSGGSAKVTAAAAALVPAFPKHAAPNGDNGGATDTGVTKTTITTGSPIASSGPLPGAQLNTWLGTKAYYAYVNGSGGIYGRKLVSVRMETGFDASKGQAVCQSEIPKVFALNGTQSNVDAACKPLTQKTGIPWVGNYFDPTFSQLPNAVAPLPSRRPGVTPNTVCALMKEAYPGISKVAILWINVAGIGPLVDGEKQCWESVGVKVVYDVGTDAQAPNMTPYVIQARSKGADVVDAFAQDVTNAARIAKAMNQQAYKPKASLNYAVYDAKWHKLAGPGAAGWAAVPPYGQGPFLDRNAMNKIKGGALFYKYWDKVNPGKPIDLFALEGWQQAAYFAQGLIDAGPEVTRQKLLASLKKIDKWDNMGLTAPVQWFSPGTPKDLCGVVVEATADGYRKVAPKTPGFANGFSCPGKELNG
jgi:branched-chain amino acid transport system substrate-binding protein